MSRNKILTLVAGVALAAVTAGCGGADNTNANANLANANANNANTIVVTNANNANTARGEAYNGNYNSRADYNANEANYRAEAKNAGQSIGQGLEDGWIHFKVRAALAAAADLRDSTINVDVDNNVVTLRGSVANAAQKAKAAQVAKVDGVKGNVVNRLEIRAPGDANKNGDSPTNANSPGKKK